MLPSRPGFFEILALTLSDCPNFVAAAINLLLLGISNLLVDNEEPALSETRAVALVV